MRRDPRHVRTGVHVRVGTRGGSGRARAHASAKRRRAAASSRAEHAGSHRRIPEGVVGRHHARNSAQIARWKATLNTASSAEANRIARRDASNIRHASAPPPPRAPSPTPSASLSLRGRSVKIENAAGARRGRPNGRIWIAGSIFTLARARARARACTVTGKSLSRDPRWSSLLGFPRVAVNFGPLIRGIIRVRHRCLSDFLPKDGNRTRRGGRDARFKGQ